tara:strand:+ start:543 stop:821 length:279 start_codon:yes stop_codon:yes gene_type:complete
MNSEDDEFRRIEAEAKRHAAFQRKVDDDMRIAFEAKWDDDDTQVYKKPWVGLTDEEMSDIVANMDVNFGDLLWKVVCLTKIIEAKLKELNHD